MCREKKHTSNGTYHGCLIGFSHFVKNMFYNGPRGKDWSLTVDGQVSSLKAGQQKTQLTD